MQNKPTDPLSGCCLGVVVIFILFILLALLVKSCSPDSFDSKRAAGLLASAFTGVLFWAVVFLVVESIRKD